MIEITGDLFNEPCDAFCITTNGFVKRNGECVMGRGCAKTAADRWFGLTERLGSLIKHRGNNVHMLYTITESYPKPMPTRILCSFPVKPVTAVFNGTNCVRHMSDKFNIGDTIPGWASVADIELIKRSALQLVSFANIYKWQKVVLPRPGCGAGELNWETVRNELAPIFDNRFYTITWR